MNDHCECCGVKFDGETFGNIDLIIENENHKWIKDKTHCCCGRICYWCACKLPGNLASVAVKSMFTWVFAGKNYTYDNFKTFPNLEKRIKQFRLCSTVQEEDISRWNCKCKSCGAPAYQGLMRIECSKGCK